MLRIVVGVDGSPASRHALEWAAEVAARARLELVAVTAVGPRHDGVGTIGDPALECARQLERWCAALPVRAPRRQTVVAEGDAVTVLLEESVQRDTVLLVVGSRGQGEAPGMHVGTVVHRLAHRTTVPLAIVGQAAATTTSRLVVGCDQGVAERAALAFTVEMAVRMGVPVTAVEPPAAVHESACGAGAAVCGREADAEVQTWSERAEGAGVAVDHVVPIAGSTAFDGIQRVLLAHGGAVAVVGVRSPRTWSASRAPLGLVSRTNRAVILAPDAAQGSPLSVVSTEGLSSR